MRGLLRAAAVVVVLDVIIVAPALLAATIVWSWIQSWPTWSHISGTVSEEAPLGRAVEMLLETAAWIVWAVAAMTTVIEATALLRGRTAPRVRGLAPFQAAIHSVLALGLPIRTGSGQREGRRPSLAEQARNVRRRRERPASGLPRTDGRKRRQGGAGLSRQHLAARLGRLVRVPTAERAAVQRKRTHAQDVTPAVRATSGSSLNLTEAVAAALGQLVSALNHHGVDPVPVVAGVDGPIVEVLLDQASAEALPPWEARAGGRIWSAPLGAVGERPDAESLPVPPVLTLGDLRESGVLLNLDAVRAVGLVGDPAVRLVFIGGALLELSTRGSSMTVHLVGDFDDVVPADVQIFRHPALAEAVAAIEEATAGIDRPFRTEGLVVHQPAPTALRVVVVAGHPSAEIEAIERLVHLCSGHGGVVAVFVDGCPAGAFEVRVAKDELVLPALGLRCPVQTIDNESTGEGEVSPSAADVGDESPAFSDLPAVEETGGKQDAECRYFLHLLGPITVEGVDIRPQQLAILAYLAVNGETTADALRDAVWGGKPPTKERFLNTMHELRRVLGPEVLPSSRDGRYRLHHVWSDLAEVERLVASASAQSDTASADLRAVLELISGPPISYESRHRRHFRWVDLGNHASHWERIVCDAAHRLASMSLQADDVDLARWAAERGLLACPGSETLTADLVRAHLAAGDRKTAERVVGEYSRSLEDAGDEPPPSGLRELLGSTPEA